MFTRAMLLCSVLVAALGAGADQAEWVEKAVADKADAALDYGTEIRQYCPLCGDKTYRREIVADKYTEETETKGRFSIYVNGAPIDLAYVYVKKDEKWTNLGKLCGATVDSVPDELPADLPAGMSDFDRVKYIGTIDGKLVISAELSKFDKELTGGYWYSHVGTRLNLQGEFDPLGGFTLTETGEDEKKSGEFTGKLTEGGAKAEGTWTSADGTKKLPFVLKRIALNGDENGTIIAGSQGSETHLDFPVFLSAFGPAYTAVNEAIQSTIRTRFAEYASQFATTAAELGLDESAPHGDEELGQSISIGEHEIRLANDNVVSVLFMVSLYQGGAHGMSMSLPVNLRITKAGEAYKTKPIALTDLLKPGADALKALSDFVLEDLKKKNASLVVDGSIKAFKAEELSSFTLSPKGITLYFDPYAVASYAEGPFEVTVPFAALPDAFSADGIAGIAETK